LTHHFASTKAVDAVYNAELSPTGEKLRRLIYNSYMFGDHLLHFYYLASPDFVLGPDADPAVRNVLGVIGAVGLEIGGRVIKNRANAYDVMKYFGGKRTHPICGVPGGVSRALTEEYRQEMIPLAEEAVEFGKFTLQLFRDVVLANETYLNLVLSETYGGANFYNMGMVNADNKVEFYDGPIRVTDPEGAEFCKFEPKDYLDHISEHVEPWTYIKAAYLKNVGWNGFTDGKDSGIYRVGPLARLNAADGMQTPVAQEAFEEMYSTLGGHPAHATLATHWARIIEMVQGAEIWLDMVKDKSLTEPDIRQIPTETPSEGVGIIAAARGTLIHHYITDDNGIVEDANLIVATTNNYAAINTSVGNAAKGAIKNGDVSEPFLNMVEMAFRAYDPCFGCATHTLPGQMPLEAHIHNSDGELIQTLSKNLDWNKK